VLIALIQVRKRVNSAMTTQQEIQTWLEQYRQLEKEDARQQFYQNLLTSLGSKNSDDLREGLLALKQSVRTTGMKAEKIVQTKSAKTLQIFPNTQEEQELLQKLLEHLNIPFKMSA